MEFQPLEFLCDKILPSVGLAMLAGPPKARKSFQVLCMALDMTQKGHSVFYIAAEDNDRRLNERIKQVFPEPSPLLTCHAGLSQEYPIPWGRGCARLSARDLRKFKTRLYHHRYCIQRIEPQWQY